MGDILKPNTSESLVEQVRRRRIPTIGNAGYPSPAPVLPEPVIEQQQPPAPPVAAPIVEQPVAAPTLVEQEQPVSPTLVEQEQPVSPTLQEQPVPPTLQEQQTLPSVFAPSSDGGGFQVEEPRQPDANFGDILTAPTLQPIYQQSAETQRRAQPEEMVEALQSIQVPQVQFANVPVTSRNTVTSRVEALRQANEHIVRQNRGGLQDFSVAPGGGERMFKTSAIDNALAGTGLGSILGTNLQDRLDPNRYANDAGGILGWIQQVGSGFGKAAKQIPGLAQGVLGWLISSPLNTDITPEKRRENEAWEQEGWQKWRESGGLDDLTNNTVPETSGGRLTLETYGTVFDPVRGYWGDAGKNPLLSPLIYLLNIPENILMGMVYDTADALGGDKSKSWDNRTRTIGALAGRDWGVSNRWSEERYISLQEPEGKVAGDRTGNPYWDLPENIAKTFGQPESGAFSKNLHIALQTVPAMVGEVITGGVADLGVGGLLKLPTKVGDVTSLGRQLDDLEATIPNLNVPGVRLGDEAVPHTSVVSVNSIEVPTQNIDPTGNPVVVRVETEPVVPSPKVETPPDNPAAPATVTESATEPELPKIEVGDGQVVKVIDIPSGRRVSDNVVGGITTPKVEVPPSAENLVRRPLSDVEGTELARRQGIIEPEFKRTLSEEELAELARQRGRLFDGQTTMHPDFTRASYVTLEDGTVRKIVLSRLSDDTLIKEGLPTVDELVGTQKDLDDLLKQYAVAPDATKSSIINNLIRQKEEALLRHAAEPAESAYTTRLLENELPSTQESLSTTAKIVGNDVVNIERALTSQRVVIEQLIQEVDEIKVVRNQLEETAPTIKPVGRQSVEDALGTYEVYSGQDVPEMGFKVSEADQYADLAGNGFNPAKATNSMDDWLIGRLPPTEFAKQNSDMTLWYHGTSSSVPIPDMDILKGATPSEYGLGVYLTKNENVADQAALALPQINRPPRPESVDTVPVRYTVDTSRVTRLFDLDAPMPKDIDELFYQTTVSIFGKNVADDAFRQSTTNVKLRQAWDSVRDSVYNVAGAPASEKQIREFQQIILEGFKERDVQAGLLKSGTDNPVMVVYNPKLLTPSSVPQKLPAPPYIKQFEARSWLDKLTRQTEPSNSNIHNSMQSNLDYAEQATRDAAENLAVELNRQKEMLEEYIVKKDNLETIVRKEQKETVRQLEATGDTVESVRSVVRNDLVESAKTRRQRARQTSEAKDYSVPKAKRGKNPPAVSDKPISGDALPNRSSRFGDLISTLEANQVSEQSNLVDLLTVAVRLEPDNKDFKRALELAKQGKTVDMPTTKPRKLGQIISDLEGTQARGIKVDAEMYGKVAEAYVKKYGYATSSNELPSVPTGKKSIGASKQTDLSETLKDTPKPEPVPVEVIPVDVEPMKVGVPLEGKRKGLGDRIREQADKIREASKQEAEALTKILDNAGKISQNYEKLVDEVVEMVNEDLDKAAKMEATPKVRGVKVPDFTVKQSTQLSDIKDWKSAGVEGFHSFGDKTDFMKKYPKDNNFLDDLADVKVDRNYVENTYQNQRNYQNILNGKNPLFDEAPLSEWVPSTGKLEWYANWTDYAKKYSPKKYEHTAPAPVSKGGVTGFTGELYDLGSSKTFQDRQEEFLIKHFGAVMPDGTPVAPEILENTHWNLEAFKRIREGKKPLFNKDANPFPEWVPSTGELLAYKDWDDYADQYSVSKYTHNSTTTPVSPKVRSTKTDKMVENLLKDWDNVTLGDVRSANKQAKKFEVPELDDPCL